MHYTEIFILPSIFLFLLPKCYWLNLIFGVYAPSLHLPLILFIHIQYLQWKQNFLRKWNLRAIKCSGIEIDVFSIFKNTNKDTLLTSSKSEAAPMNVRHWNVLQQVYIFKYYNSCQGHSFEQFKVTA